MNNRNSLEEWSDWLIGQRLGAVLFNFTVQLYLQYEKDCRITIEGKFFWTQDGSTYVLDPLHPTELCSLLTLPNSRIVSARIEEAGIITLDFDKGQRLQVKPDDQYEAWNFRDKASKTLIVCLPGGGLMHFSGEGITLD